MITPSGFSGFSGFSAGRPAGTLGVSGSGSMGAQTVAPPGDGSLADRVMRAFTSQPRTREQPREPEGDRWGEL